MENNNSNKNVFVFDNLKKLSSMLSNNDFNYFAGNINKAKKSLDLYCKQLKEVESKLAIKPEPKVEEKPKEVEKPTVAVSKPTAQPQTQINNHTNFAPRKQGDVFVRRNLENNQNREYRQYNRNNQGNNGYQNNNNGYRPNNNGGFRPNNTGFRPNTNGFRPNGPRPFNNGQNGQNGYRPNNNGYRPNNGVKKPFGSVAPAVDIVTKPERSFGNKSKFAHNSNDNKGLSIKTKIRMGLVDFGADEYNDENMRMGRVRKVHKNTDKEMLSPEKINIDHAIITTDNLTVKIFSEKIGKPVTDIIKKFMMLGMMLTINSPIDFATAELVASEFGITLEQKLEQTAEDQLNDIFAVDDANAVKRPPVVTVMGHVDHGKTSLLDTIRKTNVISGEAGGITQAIGAYSVELNGKKITFIDTPGHEAFTSMRARGAKVTDLAILVVAADDGIMPQTIEAIHHIQAAKVPMVVAINKMDKPEANPERVKQELTENGVLPEEWGGDTICVPISAKKGTGIDKLLEMVLLVADMQDLKADPKHAAAGYVIESKIDNGRGIIATILIKNGTLHIGDYLVSGVASGRVKAMVDCNGKNVKTAGPSMPVSVLGFNTVPEAGDKTYVVDEKLAKNIVSERQAIVQEEKINNSKGMSLEDFLSTNADQVNKTLNIIIKADVNGSAEALKQTLEKISNDEVKVNCIHSSVGAITESDVLLAQASKAIIIGFNVRPMVKAKALAEHNGVDIKLYRIIYEAVDDVTKAINGMLAPKFEDNITGHAEIRHVFKISKVGIIAGCYVTDGEVLNNSKVHLLRNNVVIAETEIETLQVQKDQAKSVKMGFECGIKLKNYSDIHEGDVVEAYSVKQI